MYGPLMRPCPMICGPVNEMGVVYLFGAMAEKLGFVVLRIRTGVSGLRSVDAGG